MLRTLILIAAIQLSWIGDVFAEETDIEVACAATAFKEYLAANEIFKNSKGVEDQIQQRRLQERFCLRFVQCIGHDQGTDADGAPASHFSDCLKEEAIELYKLYRD